MLVQHTQAASRTKDIAGCVDPPLVAAWLIRASIMGAAVVTQCVIVAPGRDDGVLIVHQRDVESASNPAAFMRGWWPIKAV
jgi:hypothetical protein